MFSPIPIKVLGEIVGYSTQPSDKEIEDWNKFEHDFKEKYHSVFVDLLPTYKEIYMKELDTESRYAFLGCFK